MALYKLCLNNKETLILHKKIGYYKFCSSNKTTPKNTTTLKKKKKFPRKMWFRQGNNLTFKRFCSTARSRKKKKKKQMQ